MFIFVVLYSGTTVQDAEPVAVTVQRDVVRIVADSMLRREESLSDPLRIGSKIHAARAETLRDVIRQTRD